MGVAMKTKTYHDGIMDERKRILESVKAIEDQSHATRTPLFQDTLFDLVKDVVMQIHPPRRFRDISNGE